MNIIGLNAYHGDSSACLVIDGRLIAAAEEERFNRIKHWAGFPSQAIRYCLHAGGIRATDVDHICVNREPRVHFLRKILFTVNQMPSPKVLLERLSSAARVSDIRRTLARSMDLPVSAVCSKIHHVEHHRAHLASTFFVSPFREAAILSVDGFGDFVSTMWGRGKDNNIRTCDQIFFPHSLGLFYLAITQFIGFRKYGDEYKVMGLAAYGKPHYMAKMRRIVRLKPRGHFELDLRYFRHHAEGVSMTWNEEEPVIGDAFSSRMVELFGPERKSGESLSQHHMDVAASGQAMYEEAFFHILRQLHQKTKLPAVCLAGGCGFNSVANGKILKETKFQDVYVQAASGDAGGAIGAAYYVWNHVLGNPHSFVMRDAYCGPAYDDGEISERIMFHRRELELNGCAIQRIEQSDVLDFKTAQAISKGKIVGYFQGRMEWGPRALGNRSILCDPRQENMKDMLNLRIKHRETFRPFAPAILREAVSEWFETNYDVPFMSQVFRIREDKRRFIPAVTHVDGTGRLQTVTREDNPHLYQIISAFRDITGIPLILNTSFNENEPIVCSPENAIQCFLKTKMDVLVIGSYYLSRISSNEELQSQSDTYFSQSPS